MGTRFTTGLLFAVLIVGQPAGAGLAQPLDARLDAYVGAYRVPPHGTMSLSRFEHGGRVIHLFTDFSDGWRGVVEPGRGDTLRIVPHEGPAPEARPRIVLGEDTTGRRTVSLHLEDRPTRVGRKLALRVEPVTFSSGALELAGEIVLSGETGGRPGVVFVHGSGPATRNDYREWSWYFAANDVATLIYDKRGAGDSEGDWREAKFPDLARDAIAAVRRLRAHPGVDPGRVGLSGGSQGAWVAPIAARMDEEIRFLVPTGGGPITPAEQEIYRRARVVQDAGHPAETVDVSREVVTLYFDYLGSGGEDEELAARVSEAWRRYGAEEWFPLLDLPASDPTVEEWPEGRRRFAEELFFDPAPSVRAISLPTLAILAGEDQGFPTRRTAAAWRNLVDPEWLELWIIPGVDHGFWVTGDPARGRHQSPRIFEGLLAWIHRTVGGPPPLPRLRISRPLEGAFAECSPAAPAVAPRSPGPPSRR
ncbi:MAG: alpha/beta fold hydrolase [Gemmatimonadota bacterium]|nr:alpha/beta fold hydrolase [Gemmatimonadota bacterium]